MIWGYIYDLRNTNKAVDSQPPLPNMPPIIVAGGQQCIAQDLGCLARGHSNLQPYVRPFSSCRRGARYADDTEQLVKIWIPSWDGRGGPEWILWRMIQFLLLLVD